MQFPPVSGIALDSFCTALCMTSKTDTHLVKAKKLITFKKSDHNRKSASNNIC